MLTDERRDLTRAQLARHGRVLANDLAAQFDVSEDTVRRDLRELARQGFCRRVYGGALLPSPDSGTLATRLASHADARAALAQTTVQLLKDGQTIFIDAGSTNLAVADALPQDLKLTVVTNAPTVAVALTSHPNHAVVVLGGQFDQAKGACLGPQTIREATQIFADMVILGTCGVDSMMGVTALDAAEAEVKRTLLAQSSLLVIAATSGKLGTIAPFKVADPSRIDHLIVEAGAGDVSSFEALDIKVHRSSAFGER
jgi:DeoR/GlpR family transcriptional regulator of sugar metabolism